MFGFFRKTANSMLRYRHINVFWVCRECKCLGKGNLSNSFIKMNTVKLQFIGVNLTNPQQTVLIFELYRKLL